MAGWRLDLNIQITGELRPIFPDQPGPLSVTQIRERITTMGQFYGYKVHLPEIAKPNDVVKRILSVRVAPSGGEVGGFSIDEIGPDAQELTEPRLEFPITAQVDLYLYHVDAAGGKSPASTYSFIVEDKTPPPVPGEMGVSQVSERITEDEPAPEPAPEPEPTPEPTSEPPAPPAEEPPPLPPSDTTPEAGPPADEPPPVAEASTDVQTDAPTEESTEEAPQE